MLFGKINVTRQEAGDEVLIGSGKSVEECETIIRDYCLKNSISDSFSLSKSNVVNPAIMTQCVANATLNESEVAITYPYGCI